MSKQEIISLCRYMMGDSGAELLQHILEQHRYERKYTFAGGIHAANRIRKKYY